MVDGACKISSINQSTVCGCRVCLIRKFAFRCRLSRGMICRWRSVSRRHRSLHQRPVRWSGASHGDCVSVLALCLSLPLVKWRNSSRWGSSRSGNRGTGGRSWCAPAASGFFFRSFTSCFLQDGTPGNRFFRDR